jgi:hypothetical protein
MNSLASGQNSLICSEESCNNPFADSIITSESIYNLCSEEVVNITLCACGCGHEIIIKRHHKWAGIPKYISGHYRRGKKIGYTWMKGKTHTLESINKMSESHKGKTPWNKNKKGIHLSPATEFKKGQASTRKDEQLSEETKKKISQSRLGKYKGESNPNWRGGIAFLPYCSKFNKELKERIRDRDKRTCQLCGEKENGKRLRVHHIHYDKPNCEPDLLSLCHSCHAKTNGNRDYWEDYFIELLIRRGIITNYIFPKWWYE